MKSKNFWGGRVSELSNPTSSMPLMKTLRNMEAKWLVQNHTSDLDMESTIGPESTDYGVPF